MAPYLFDMGTHKGLHVSRRISRLQDTNSLLVFLLCINTTKSKGKESIFMIVKNKHFLIRLKKSWLFATSSSCKSYCRDKASAFFYGVSKFRHHTIKKHFRLV